MMPARQRHRVDLVLTLVWRDLVLRYRRSVLGIAWSQLAPLATLGVLALLFTRAIPLHIPHYALFVVTGLLAWTWFAGAIVAATESVVQSRDLVRQPGFPVALLPVVAISTHLIHLILVIPVLLLIIWLVIGHVALSVTALPLLIVVQFLITLGPAYLLASMNVRFRDVGHMVGVLLLPLFYATPVFYDSARIPRNLAGLYGLNPFAHLVNGYRDALLVGRWPESLPMLAIALAGGLTTFVGYKVYRFRAIEFAEQL